MEDNELEGDNEGITECSRLFLNENIIENPNTLWKLPNNLTVQLISSIKQI